MYRIVAAALEFRHKLRLRPRNLLEVIVIVNELVSHIFTVGASAFRKVTAPTLKDASIIETMKLMGKAYRGVTVQAINVYIATCIREVLRPRICL